MACTKATIPRSSKWSLYFMFSNQNPVPISLIPTCATCPIHPYNIDDECRSWSSSLFSFLQPPVTYSCLGSNILPKTLLKGDINNFFFWRCDPTWVMASSFLRFLDHTQRRTTIGRTPLDEWSARRRDLYLTTLKTNKHPCPQWDSNPRSQQASGHRPTP